MLETWRSIIRPAGDAFASSNPVRIDLSGSMNAIISCYEQRIPRRPLEIYGSAEDTKKKLETKTTPSSCNFPLHPAISMLWFSFRSSILGSSDRWSSSANWKAPGSFLSKTLWHASRLAASTCGVVRWHCTIPWKELQRRGLHDIGIIEAYQRIDIWFVRRP